MMRMTKSVIATVVILMVALMPAELLARDYLTPGNALKELLPAGQGLFKEELKLSKDQAKQLNSKYKSEYRADEKITVYYTKDQAGVVSAYAIILEDILWEYMAYHVWALAYTPEGVLRGIRIIKLTDEYTFEMPNPRFLKQFDNKVPKDIKMPGNVDAMSGATMSSKLLVGSTNKAWEMIQLSTIAKTK